jgi:hypothetical protein
VSQLFFIPDLISSSGVFSIPKPPTFDLSSSWWYLLIGGDLEGCRVDSLKNRGRLQMATAVDNEDLFNGTLIIESVAPDQKLRKLQMKRAMMAGSSLLTFRNY